MATRRKSGNKMARQQNPTTILILPFMAVLSVTCLVFSELKYLLPVTRVMSTQSPGHDIPAVTRSSFLNEFDVFKSLRGVGDPRTTKTTATLAAPVIAEEPKQTKFERIVLLGERHSGTSYTTKKLEECFPELDVSDFLVRYKHWFQPDPSFVVEVAKELPIVTEEDPEGIHKISEHWPEIAKMENPKDAFKNTLVIVMFRNAYDWLEAMRLGPHHWTNHFRMERYPDAPVTVETEGDNAWYGSEYFSWKEFLDANMTLSGNEDETGLCQNAFKPGTVSPCHLSKEMYPVEVTRDYMSDLNAAPDELPFNGHHAIYEMNDNNKPFQNPLELRTAKIVNFLNLPNQWNLGGFMTLRHEDINIEGSGFLLEQVSKVVGMKPECDADPPRNQAGRELTADWMNWISENADWEQESKLGYERRPQQIITNEQATQVDMVKTKSEPRSFDRIVLLGERHSGTSYTTNLLERCFPDLHVSDFLVRYKHWFQPDPSYVVDVSKKHLSNLEHVEQDEIMHKIGVQWPSIAALDSPKSAFKRTLVIVMFRNVYDWMEAMRLGPHHWPNHFRMEKYANAPVPVENPGDDPWYGSGFLTWREFLDAEMIVAGENGADVSQLCQNAYPYGAVSPCKISKETYPPQVKKDFASDLNAAPNQLPFNADHPIYEMNADGKPFKNALEMRTAKIHNFLDLPNQWDLGGFMTLQQEDLNLKGSGFLLEEASKILGMKPECEADPPKNQGHNVLNPDFLDWISANADWQAEGRLGYKQRAV